MQKSSVLLLILILTMSSLTIVRSLGAQTTPSVPEFTLKLVDNSYDIAPTYRIDSYTGENVTVTEGYHVQNRSIEVTIKNQRFTAYIENGTHIRLYYSVRFKGHFADWGYEPSPDTYVQPSYSEFTVITYGVGRYNGHDHYNRRLADISGVGVVDFQVVAITGYYTRIPNTPSPADQFSHGEPGYREIFTEIEKSNLSEAQTITISEDTSASTAEPTPTPTPTPEDAPTPLQSPTVTPTQPITQGVSPTEFYTVIAIFATTEIAALVVIIAVFSRKIKKHAENKQ